MASGGNQSVLSPILKKLTAPDDDDEHDLLALGAYTQGYCLQIVEFAIEERKKKKSEQAEIYRLRDIEAGKIWKDLDQYEKEWNDRDTGFDYFLTDMPVLDPTVSGPIIPLVITRFEHLDDCSAIMMHHGIVQTRRKLCSQITKYCLTVPPDDDFMPEPGQIIFVKIPTWAEVESSIRFEHLCDPMDAEEWLEKNRDLHEPEFEDLEAHQWTRGIFMEKVKEDSPDHRCNSLIVDLVDFGRKIPVIRDNVRKAIYRFVPFPVSAVRITIVIDSVKQYNDAARLKWKRFLRPGLKVNVLLLADCEFMLIVRLHNPTEQALESSVAALQVKS